MICRAELPITVEIPPGFVITDEAAAALAGLLLDAVEAEYRAAAASEFHNSSHQQDDPTLPPSNAPGQGVLSCDQS
jgi:hypothetical protein